MARIPAQVERSGVQGRKPKKGLDSWQEKRRRGRPARMRASEIRGRADNYRWIFDQVWDRLWPLLSKVQTEEEAIKAFEEGANPYQREFVPFAPLAVKILRERRFPKHRKAEINFLADSLAGLGQVSPRRSRDICEEERTKEKNTHHIIRYEFYIECSCGHKGRSRDHSCPKCGTRIDFGFNSVFNSGAGPTRRISR
jgi:hypothetical protein